MLIAEVLRAIDDRPRLDYCHRPSPLRELSHCQQGLGGSRIFVKEDGFINPLYGGNKARKLEFILAHAIHIGAREVCTVGGIGSHHALATAIFAKRLGLSCRLLLSPQPMSAHAQAIYDQIRKTDAEVTLIEGEAVTSAQFFTALRVWRSSRPDAFLIPTGGSSVEGTYGYVEAGIELAQQIDAQEIPLPQVIYVAVGSGSTLAGLTLGLRVASLAIEVIGVRVTPPYLVNTRGISSLHNRCVSALQLDPRLCISPSEIQLVHGYIGDGYGCLTDEGNRAQTLALKDGLSLDPIYSAKALAALLDREQTTRRDVLFWSTASGVTLE
jgi:1-aminocyclopropane-1-carboxylate deaminase/D-cysteine desulfhydrase-like pyridoxal-dependent ACC family enzyme